MTSSESYEGVEPAQILPLNPVRHTLERSLAQKAQSLLNGSEGVDLAELAPLELYYLAKEGGLDETLPAIFAAKPDALQRFVDLDCWHEESFAPLELDAYLAPFLEQSKARLAEAFLSLDDEVQILFMQASIQVFDNREDTLPEVPDDQPTRVSPDGFFFLVNLAPEREVDPFVLIDALVEHGREVAFQLLTAAKWELPSAIEEQGLQFRGARLGDLGFVERAEALGLLAPPPPELSRLVDLPVDAMDAEKIGTQGGSWRAPLPDAGFPAIYARVLHGASQPLVRALSTLDQPGRVHALFEQWVQLTHQVIVLQKSGAHNLSQIEQVATLVRDTLSLGLCCICPADHPRATQLHANVLFTWSLHDLFRLGVAQLKPLVTHARALSQHQHYGPFAAAADDGRSDVALSARMLVEGLLEHPPVWMGWDPLVPRKRGAFSDPQQLEDTRVRLETLERQLAQHD